MRMSAVEWVFFVLLLVGGLNWGLIGFFDYNLVAELFSSEDTQRLIYAIVGVATIATLASTLIRANAVMREDVE